MFGYIVLVCCFLSLSTASSQRILNKTHITPYQKSALKTNRRCPTEEWAFHENACYLHANLKVNFEDAARYCETLFGSHLIVVKNEDKLNVLRNMLQTEQYKKAITWVYLFN